MDRLPRPIAVVLPIPRDNYYEEIWEFWESDISTTSSESESSSDSESYSESESDDEPPSRIEGTPLEGRNPFATFELVLRNNFSTE